MKADELAPLLGDLRQFASVRPVVLDDGAERGQRALLFSTGGGLEFMVLPDRALDIGTLSYRGLPVAWQSPAGLRSPYLADPDSEGGTGFNRSFSGLLVTCGLEHIRQPAGGSPLHGRLPGTPARLLAQGEDWDRPEPIIFCAGETVQAAYGKESLRIRRRIEAPIGGTTLVIRDRVENIGPEPAPHAILYHLNVGYPAIATGSIMKLGGTQLLGPLALADPSARPQVECHPAGPAGGARATIETPLGDGAVEIAVAFSARTLPYLQVWRDLRPRVGVLALEPCSTARETGSGEGAAAVLQPGEAVDYEVRLSFATL
jgi:hypothetical protein